ncbi:MAG: glycosyltransferase [Candidatus Bathyarchaeota archaeon]|nr:glycosyltransferase [Candidatus Bathyarchaeota archaeon]
MEEKHIKRESEPKFSIVCPIHNEVHFIPITLPSFYSVNPDEVVLCFDNPPDSEALGISQKIASRYNISTRFLFVDRNPRYRLHQTWVRRKGFLEARNDKILTTDIDLVINTKVLKAVRLVGKNSIGLVSCSKRYYPKSIFRIWNNTAYDLLTLANRSYFTGLYAIWRPYWLDSEDEGRCEVCNPKVEDITPDTVIGEDTYLRNCMSRKYRTIYLKDVGAFDMNIRLNDLSKMQYDSGRIYAKKRLNIVRILMKTLLYGRLKTLSGWVSERRRIYG